MDYTLYRLLRNVFVEMIIVNVYQNKYRDHRFSTKIKYQTLKPLLGTFNCLKATYLHFNRMIA